MAAPDFDSTLWSQIYRARDRSSDAWNAFLRRYRPPVRRYLEAHGLQAADAEDLSQEVFGRILEKGLLQKADREKGRFRALLLGIVRNVLREDRRARGARKRGGGRRAASLDALPDEVAAPVDPEEPFDRLWIANLVEQALRAVRERDPARGERYVTVLRRRALEGASHEELARSLDLSIQDVKNALHRARRRVWAEIERLVREYSSSHEEYAAEVKFVKSLLAKGAVTSPPAPPRSGETSPR